MLATSRLQHVSIKWSQVFAHRSCVENQLLTYALPLHRSKVSLNTLANDQTFRLLDGVLQQGVNLKEVGEAIVAS